MSNPVAEHYGQPNLLERIDSAFASLGKDSAHLTTDDLAPVDQFHTGGMEATAEMARLGEISWHENVLDVGGGIGGPARQLSSQFGCHVTVLDLTEEFVRVGAALTPRVGLKDRVSFQQGDALRLPFPDASFDVTWTQHSTMNIPDKPLLYRELHRVTKPGGRMILHEIMAGPLQPIHFPVPWASEASLSYLSTPEVVQENITSAEFRQIKWIDASEHAQKWFLARIAALRESTPSPLGLNLILGERAPQCFQNVMRNLQENRARVIQAVFARP